jgi:hypothetical protein
LRQLFYLNNRPKTSRPKPTNIDIKNLLKRMQVKYKDKIPLNLQRPLFDKVPRKAKKKKRSAVKMYNGSSHKKMRTEQPWEFGQRVFGKVRRKMQAVRY